MIRVKDAQVSIKWYQEVNHHRHSAVRLGFLQKILIPRAVLNLWLGSCVTAQVLGMELIDKMDGSDFTLYFLAYLSEEEQSLNAEEKAKTKFNRQDTHFTFNLPNLQT